MGLLSKSVYERLSLGSRLLLQTMNRGGVGQPEDRFGFRGRKVASGDGIAPQRRQCRLAQERRARNRTGSLERRHAADGDRAVVGEAERLAAQRAGIERNGVFVAAGVFDGQRAAGERYRRAVPFGIVGAALGPCAPDQRLALVAQRVGAGRNARIGCRRGGRGIDVEHGAVSRLVVDGVDAVVAAAHLDVAEREQVIVVVAQSVILLAVVVGRRGVGGLEIDITDGGPCDRVVDRQFACVGALDREVVRRGGVERDGVGVARTAEVDRSARDQSVGLRVAVGILAADVRAGKVATEEVSRFEGAGGVGSRLDRKSVV